MAAGAFQTYEAFVEYQEKSIIETGDAIKAALFLSTSNAGDLTRSIFGQLTNEHAAANGYVAGGVAVAGFAISRAGRILTFDCNDPQFVAAGGNIVARRLVLYKPGLVSGVQDPLIATCLLDDAPADVVVNDGITLVIQIPATGIVTIGGGS